MTSRAILQLAAQHQPTERDRLEFGNRLRSEHLITSVQEAIEIINDCISHDCKKLAMYNVYNIGFDINPVLTMNLIDEAVISMIYYIFQASNDGDEATLGYYRNIIDDYLPSLKKLRTNSRSNLVPGRTVITQLYNMMDAISHAAFPVNDTIDEESSSGNLAVNYYCLMFFCCDNVKHDRYFSELGKFYVERAKNKEV